MSYDLSALPDVSHLTVGIVGGTGEQGRGLSYRLARAGHQVRIGSRSAERGRRVAAELADLPNVPHDLITGGENAYACATGIVIIAVPWEGHGALLADLAEALTGRLVVDCVNPIGFDARGAYPLPVPEGSAAAQAAALLPGSTVCAAFHHASAVLLNDPEIDLIDLDVLVLGDDREAAAQVQALAARIPGVRGIYAGRLRNAGQVEALTANLISINRRYRAHAGVRVTDV